MDAFKEDPEPLFHELSAHLSQVSESPATPLDADLLKRGERSLDHSTPRQNLWSLLQTGETLLESLQQDPTPLTRLLESIIRLLPFDNLRTTIDPTQLISGLTSPSVPIQLLCLAYLQRASSTPSGAAFVAASSSLVATLFATWLSTPSAEIADTALSTIISLLTVDQPSTTTFLSADSQTRGAAQGQGLLWRRVFHDPDVYALFFAWTTLSPTLSLHASPGTKKGVQQITLSQARLLDFLARTAILDFAPITTTSLPDVERPYLQSGFGKTSTSQPKDTLYDGLLLYTATFMVDPSDILMEFLRRDFFVKLLGVAEEQGPQTQVSPQLLKAIKDDAGVSDEPEDASNGLHL